MRRRTTGVAALAAALAVVSAACSVSSPRNGESVAAGPGADGGASGVGADGSPVGGSSDGATVGEGSADDLTGDAVGGEATSSRAPAGATAPVRGSGTAAARTAPGVTADSVAVSIVAGFSGPLGPVLEKAYQGLETWRDDVNRSGGVHGRQVVLKKVDHKETADGGVAACKVALSNGTLFAAVPEGVDATLSAISCMDDAGMPTVYYSGTTDPKWKYAFSDIATSAQGGVVMGSYVAKTLKGESKRVGVLYVNQLAYKSFSDTFVPEARRLKVDVVANDPVEPNQASFTPQLLKMRDAGVQILVISATTEAVGILRDARSIGWSPVFTGFGFQFDFVTVGARSLFDGVTGLRTYATVDSPAYQKYAARMEANGRGRDRAQDLEGLPAYGHGLVIGEMLRRAGPQPTRATIVSGAETIRDFDTGILPPITWGPGRHEGVEAAFPTVCCNGDYTWKGAGPARKAFG